MTTVICRRPARLAPDTTGGQRAAMIAPVCPYPRDPQLHEQLVHRYLPRTDAAATRVRPFEDLVEVREPGLLKALDRECAARSPPTRCRRSSAELRRSAIARGRCGHRRDRQRSRRSRQRDDRDTRSSWATCRPSGRRASARPRRRGAGARGAGASRRCRRCSLPARGSDAPAQSLASAVGREPGTLLRATSAARRSRAWRQPPARRPTRTAKRWSLKRQSAASKPASRSQVSWDSTSEGGRGPCAPGRRPTPRRRSRRRAPTPRATRGSSGRSTGVGRRPARR